jgi:transcriptional regulator with XRE-family HTH domain
MTSRSDDALAQFARRVERLQRAQGLSTADLATRSNLDRPELEEILRGEGKASVDVIYLLAGALGVAPGELLEDCRPSQREGGGDRLTDESRDD